MADVPICSDAAERSVLRAWISDRQFRQAWRPEPDLFYGSANVAIAECLERNWGAKRFGEAVLLGELDRAGKLQRCGGRDAVLEAVTGPVVADPWRDVERLRELAALRDLKSGLVTALAELGPASKLEDVQASLRTADASSVERMGSRIIEATDLAASVEQHAYSTESIRFCTTLYRRLDSETGGIRPGDAWLFQACTNWGKSSYTVGILDENTERGKRVLLVTCEDRPDIYARRVACRRAGVRYSRLRDRRLEPHEQMAVSRATHNIARKPWWTIDGRGKPAELLASQVRSAIACHGIDLVVVDYVQAMRLKHRGRDGRAEDLATIGRILTDTTKSAGSALWMVSQTTPERGREDGLYSTRGSKELTTAAEVVLVGSYYEDARTPRGERRRKLVAAKVKEGPAGREFEVEWDAVSASFVADIDEQLGLDLEE